MSTRARIRVLVVDHSEAMRHSLHQVVSIFTDLQWVGEVRDGESIIPQCERLCPDILLMDVGLPHVDVTQIVCEVRHAFPAMKIIGFVGFEEQILINGILKAGATVCLSKTTNIITIVEVIRRVSQSISSIS